MADVVRTGPGRYRLTAELWLPEPRDRVFAFFSNARNLEAITPPWIGFNIVTPGEIDMKAGALIDYRISLHGFPLTWRTRISAWEPPERFVDEQLKGPYRSWLHEHLFEERNGGTLCRDRVDYEVPLGDWVNDWIVGDDVKAIFEYRRMKLEYLFRGGPSMDPL
jgi:ligand-binding SRPBCC domain-containing protein